MTRFQSTCLMLMGVLTGCIELPEFPPPYLVERPRILAIVAEPPEFQPGQDVTFSVMVSTEEVQRVEWRLCPGFYAMGPSQYDEGIDDEGCAGGMTWPLPEGRETTLPGLISQNLATAELGDLPDVVLGVPLSPTLLQQVVDEVGFPLQVEVRVHSGDTVLTGLKRILVSGRQAANTNPPPPHLRVGDVEVVHTAGFECEAADGGPVRLAAGEEVELVPILDGDADGGVEEGEDAQEPWLQDYRVLDAKGQLSDRTESAFYSYFTTGGSLATRTTRAPLRNNLFTPPASGCARMWVVQQDGHAGVSACSFVVWTAEESEPQDDCPLSSQR